MKRFLVLWMFLPIIILPEILPLNQVKIGMKGYGKTIFKGNKIDTFGVEILGVLKNIGAGKNIILGKLSGGPLKVSGVAQGMSGSPVFINGKIAGAVAFAWSFAKEPICGITPIEEILKTKNDTLTSPPSLDKNPRGMENNGVKLTPIENPVVLSGFEPLSIDYLKKSLSLTDVVTGGENENKSAPLSPGGILNVLLLTGDGQMSVSGTITYVDGNKIYGFGHPMFMMGKVAMPISSGYVYTFMPSALISFRISSPSKPIGTLKIDGKSGVYGEIGKLPKMVNLTLDVNNEKKHYQSVRSKYLLPSIASFVAYNILLEKVKISEATISDSIIIFANGKTFLKLRRLSAGLNVVPSLIGNINEIISYLMNNPFTPLMPDSIRMGFSIRKHPEIITIQDIKIPGINYKEGDTLDLTIDLKRYRGKKYKKHLRIPLNGIQGKIIIRVSGGNEDFLYENQRLPNLTKWDNLNDAKGYLKKQPEGDEIVIKLYSQRKGVYFKGKELSNIPPSVLSIFPQKDNIQNTIVYKKVIHTEKFVKGAVKKAIEIKKGGI